MKNVRLKDLEIIIGSQLLIHTVLAAAKRDIPTLNQETLDQAIFITQSSLNDLVVQFQKRTNEKKAEAMIARCDSKLFVEVSNG